MSNKDHDCGVTNRRAVRRPWEITHYFKSKIKIKSHGTKSNNCNSNVSNNQHTLIQKEVQPLSRNLRPIKLSQCGITTPKQKEIGNFWGTPTHQKPMYTQNSVL